MNTWHHQFANQLAQAPDAVALRNDQSTVSYAQLDAAACQLANRLHQSGITVGSTVGLAMSCCIDYVHCMLACAKLGAQFLPMDPDFPLVRLQYMADQSDVRIVLCNNESDESRLRLFLTKQSFLLVPIASTVTTQSKETPSQKHSGPADMAYTLFTSGSTGKPKGVQVDHSALDNLLQSMRSALTIGSATTPPVTPKFLALTTPSFDISILEMLLPLICGGEVLFAKPGAARDPREIAELVTQHNPTHIQATPTAWQMLLASSWQPPQPLTLISGGEPLSEATAAGLLATGCTLFNAYGPTETTIWSSVGLITDATDVHVGQPLANTRFYLADADLMPIPNGSVGELCIGGMGLARGYLQQPELTNEKFLQLPTDSLDDRSERVYRTGDRARQRDDGQFEILGRLDDQVKFHGHRIELGEIETRLLMHPGVTSAAVLINGDSEEPGSQRLVGYYTVKNQVQSSQPDAATLKRSLSDWLPAYMVPQHLEQLDEFPLTPNGKLDRERLPALEQAKSKHYEPPHGELETLMCLLFAEVLELKQIGRKESFFASGGQSLLALKLVSRIEQEIGFALPVRALFEFPTVQELCAQLAPPG